jgi:serine/threonine-protein kinase HipA
MNKAGLVYYNDIPAGRLERRDKEYVFTYNTVYLADASLPPITLSFPKRMKEYHSPVLFPFFFGLLAEGVNKRLQCTSLKIDENDHFTRLIKTAGQTTIGAISVREEE